MRTPCRVCQGTTMVIKHPCHECGGNGKTLQRKRVTVPVPAGNNNKMVSKYCLLLKIMKNFQIMVFLFQVFKMDKLYAWL